MITSDFWVKKWELCTARKSTYWLSNAYMYKESVYGLSHFCRQPCPKDLMFCSSLAAERCCVALLFSNQENNIKTDMQRDGGCSFTSWRLVQRWRRLSLCQVPSGFNILFLHCCRKIWKYDWTPPPLLTLDIILRAGRKFHWRRWRKTKQFFLCFAARKRARTC